MSLPSVVDGVPLRRLATFAKDWEHDVRASDIFRVEVARGTDYAANELSGIPREQYASRPDQNAFVIVISVHLDENLCVPSGAASSFVAPGESTTTTTIPHVEAMVFALDVTTLRQHPMYKGCGLNQVAHPVSLATLGRTYVLDAYLPTATTGVP